ncbi:MAG: hypothetical protein WCL49_05440 [bacterium]
MTAIFCGAYVGLAPEITGDVGGIRETHEEGDFRDGHVVLGQEPLDQVLCSEAHMLEGGFPCIAAVPN